MKRVLFISSSGGHLSEIMQFSPIFEEYDYYLITEKDKITIDLRNQYGSRINYLLQADRTRLIPFLYKFPLNCIKSLFLFFKAKPQVIITTGANTAVPMCYIGKVFGSKIIFIESYANIETKTLSGRLVYPIADLFVVQWQEMLQLYPKAVYKGGIY